MVSAPKAVVTIAMVRRTAKAESVFCSPTRPAVGPFADSFLVSFAACLGDTPSLVGIRREQHVWRRADFPAIRLVLADQVLQI